MPKSIRTYQRQIAVLRRTIEDMQWVQPMSNSNQSCAGCGNMRHWGCTPDCPAAAVTGSPVAVPSEDTPR